MTDFALARGLSTMGARHAPILPHHRSFCPSLTRSFPDIPPFLASTLALSCGASVLSHVFRLLTGDRFEALYVLALTTGMRLGELLDLRWRDVNFEQARLQVRFSVQEDGSKFVLAEPKTTFSRRTVALSRMAIDSLRVHKERQEEEKAKLGRAWDASVDLVFPNVISGIMIPDNLTKRSFKSFLEKAGLPDMRFHDLRHTAATLLLIKGVNVKVVSEMLGHSDISITLRIYAHVLNHMQQEAADIMDRMWGES